MPLLAALAVGVVVLERGVAAVADVLPDDEQHPHCRARDNAAVIQRRP